MHGKRTNANWAPCLWKISVHGTCVPETSHLFCFHSEMVCINLESWVFVFLLFGEARFEMVSWGYQLLPIIQLRCPTNHLVKERKKLGCQNRTTWMGLQLNNQSINFGITKVFFRWCPKLYDVHCACDNFYNACSTQCVYKNTPVVGHSNTVICKHLLLIIIINNQIVGNWLVRCWSVCRHTYHWYIIDTSKKNNDQLCFYKKSNQLIK